MKRVVVAVVAAVLIAAALVRRRVPTYPDWRAYMDDEGDALEPDPYLWQMR